ncbi:MAG: hypothetical protein V4613_08085 [Bacteroidota bacterium]
MKVFLRINNKQLFCAIIVSIVLLQVSPNSLLDGSGDLSIGTVLFLVLRCFFALIVLLGWPYTVGINLYRKLPNTVKMNIRVFKIVLGYLSVYFVAFILLSDGVLLDSGVSDFSEMYLFPFHLVSMICLAYCFYFISEILRSVELQQPVVLDDYKYYLFLFLFYPFTLWYIQQRINKIFEDATIVE